MQWPACLPRSWIPLVPIAIGNIYSLTCSPLIKRVHNCIFSILVFIDSFYTWNRLWWLWEKKWDNVLYLYIFEIDLQVLLFYHFFVSMFKQYFPKWDYLWTNKTDILFHLFTNRNKHEVKVDQHVTMVGLFLVNYSLWGGGVFMWIKYEKC